MTGCSGKESRTRGQKTPGGHGTSGQGRGFEDGETPGRSTRACSGEMVTGREEGTRMSPAWRSSSDTWADNVYTPGVPNQQKLPASSDVVS
jgi:hypothetical protein